jgi:hypothetical protein
MLWSSIAAAVLAGAGAWGGQWLGGSPATAGLGAAVGAASGLLAPVTADFFVTRRNARDQVASSAVLPRLTDGPARLLDPNRGVIVFRGRSAELADLSAWCTSDEAGRLRLMTGPGGVGKTRLALQLTQRLQELGWHCTWVGDGQEGRVLADVRAVTSGPAFLVVDYAETRVGLTDLLRVVAADDGSAIRVLLLARSAGQWWEQLGAGEAAIRDLVTVAGPTGMLLSEVLDEHLTDEEQVRAVVPVFAAALGTTPPPVVIVNPKLRRARVLELHAAALVAVLDWVAAPGAEVRVTLGGVIDELLRHEEHFWVGSARTFKLLEGPQGLTVSSLRQVVAAMCLLGATDRVAATNLLQRVPGAYASIAVTRWLRDLYPPGPDTGQWLGTVQPDRLAEHLVVSQLAASEELAEAVLANLSQEQTRRAVILLARAATEEDIARQFLARVLPLAARLVAEIDAPVDVLVSIMNALPTDVALAEARATISARILGSQPPDSHPDGADAVADLP